MRPNPGPGKLIVLEGLDGAGTTTQSRLLGERLGRHGPVEVTWEPADRPAGRLIRAILKGEVRTDLCALALLFAADRLDHIYGPGGMAEKLRRGQNVVCDRYYLSSLAYQTLDAPFSWVYAINSRALRPDLTLFLEVPVSTCLERIGLRQGRRQELFEREEALRRVRDSYYRAIRRLVRGEAFQVVDGSLPIPDLADLLGARVEALWDPGLVTAPGAQRRLARQAGLAGFADLQRRLWAEPGLCPRGLRRTAGGLELEVDTPSGREPLRLRLLPGPVAVAAPPGEAEAERGAALLERLAAEALQGAAHG